MFEERINNLRKKLIENNIDIAVITDDAAGICAVSLSSVNLFTNRFPLVLLGATCTLYFTESVVAGLSRKFIVTACCSYELTKYTDWWHGVLLPIALPL